MNKFKTTLLATIAVSGLMVGVSAIAASPKAAPIPYSTPDGITLVNVSKLMDDAIPQYLWRRLGDENGKPLYTYDADQKGTSSCYAECAAEFTPFVPVAGAKGEGDYSIITRKDGAKQWAYQGKPLYRFSGKDPVGEPVGQRFALKEDPAWADPSSSVYSPKQGFRRAAFTPEKSVLMPPDVELTANAIADGFAFVSSSTKMTVYAAPKGRKLGHDWQPMRASELALPVGDFTIVKGSEDGSRQWAYKGDLLYTFAEDYAPGEVGGSIAEKDIRAAMAFQNFQPSEVTVGQYLRGPLLTTTGGLTLYTQARYKLLYGGSESRASYGISYNEAKTQGTVGCAGDCTATWKPLVPVAGAQSRGFWEVQTRPDGGKQWAFKGTPLYTYAGDQQPGDTNGNNRHVIVYGGTQGEVVYQNPGNDPKSVKAQLGSLAMKDVDTLVPGAGRGGQGNGGGQANAAAQANGGAPADANRSGIQAVAQGGANGGNAPGFYWHTAGVFY